MKRFSNMVSLDDSSVVVGRAYVMSDSRPAEVVAQAELPVRGSALEAEMFATARERIENELEAEALSNDIFAAHLEMIRDQMFIDSVMEKIESGMRAMQAVNATMHELSQMFADIDDEYLRARAADLEDICRRIMRAMDPHAGIEIRTIPNGAIVVADEVAPSEVARMVECGAAGVVSRRGSRTSHSSILLHTAGIAVFVAAGDAIDGVVDGETLILDCRKGELILSPDETTFEQYSALVRQETERRTTERADGFEPSMPVHDRHGRRIEVLANAASIRDIVTAMDNGADGIGLLRSELMFLQFDHMPDVQEQCRLYREAAEACRRGEVTVRLLDIGADKSLPYLPLAREENPALGMRGIRLLLAREEILREQLSALLMAAVDGGIKIMLPMVSSLDELRRVRQIVTECEHSLRAEGMPFGENIQIGVMIETPAAVMIADELAGEADFFSIGTNDLSQYVMAADRNNPSTAPLCRPDNVAIQRAIKIAVTAAERRSIPVGICGEYASDTRATQTLIEAGLNKLSVAPHSVTAIKREIIRLSVL